MAKILKKFFILTALSITLFSMVFIKIYISNYYREAKVINVPNTEDRNGGEEEGVFLG